MRAERVDAGLPALRPVIGELCHRAHPGQLDGGIFVAYLRGRGREPLAVPSVPLKLGIGTVQSGDGRGDPVAPVGHYQDNEHDRPGDGGEYQWHNPYIVIPLAAQTHRLKGNGRRAGQTRSASVEERRDQRQHLAGPTCHADMRGPGKHCELRIRQEFEHLHHVRQR